MALCLLQQFCLKQAEQDEQAGMREESLIPQPF